ncbi:hypothetical protein Nepgr_031058 [Nepenthes gracilis]|uniref:Uncharacterized protein n=1 Tax=Nepenthes gracilis TaxID=150966 RepID=A0AAD3TGK7_NEPGR|nr:hypothetical protein Nepgr_031058 [Nepenthes gracilis]
MFGNADGVEDDEEQELNGSSGSKLSCHDLLNLGLVDLKTENTWRLRVLPNPGSRIVPVEGEVDLVCVCWVVGLVLPHDARVKALLPEHCIPLMLELDPSLITIDLLI